MRRVAALLSLLLAAAPASAWDMHDVLRGEALAILDEVQALPPVLVTERSEEVVGINPAVDFEFHGAGPGETQRPADILTTYAMEPDWGMDQELNASWQQRFMGGYTGLGSQGYFHMYYPALTLHLPFPVMSMGAAPKRSAQWAELAAASFAKGDDYWGWRFTAWSLHYLEDVIQPYHSTQTHRKFIQLGSPIKGTTNCTSNFHLLYEHWTARRLQEELDGRADYGLRAALRGEGDFPSLPFKKAVKKAARISHKAFGDLAAVCIQYFGDRFVSSEKVQPTEAELDLVRPGPDFDRIMEISREYHAMAGRAVRAAVRRQVRALAERDLGRMLD